MTGIARAGSSPLTRGKRLAGRIVPHVVRLIPAHAGKTCRCRSRSQPGPAHPRSRGENWGDAASVAMLQGSSPLTRGKHLLTLHAQGLERLIPAHAGKTLPSHRLSPHAVAHPRSRGENEMTNVYLGTAGGSSPLTRGKRFSVGAGLRIVRLIPAHAGKTARADRVFQSPAAHPRSRGENRTTAQRSMTLPGSSPLTRGKLLGVEPLEVSRRLIPAHAGKTRHPWGGASGRAAHPRSRGENGGRVAGLRGLRGSSPLTRGKRDRDARPWRAVGLIPAHAGKTPWSLARTSAGRAHPRSRGENCATMSDAVMTVGSSPLTRGKHQANRVGIHSSGLIPAHAGKTFVFPRPARIDAAHPRSRGENVQPATAEQIDVGSSPLTRGKQSPLPSLVGGLRLIPAHAGKTLMDSSAASRARAHPRSRGENLVSQTMPGTHGGSSPLTRGKLAQEAATSTSTRLIPAHAGKTIIRDFLSQFVPAHPRSRGENVSSRISPGW